MMGTRMRYRETVVTGLWAVHHASFGSETAHIGRGYIGHRSSSRSEMKKKLTKRRQGRVSVHAGQVEFVKVNVGGWQWRDVYQWLLGLRWPQFAALVGAFYITLNLLFATLYAVDPNSIAGTTGGRWFYDCFFFSVQTLATVGYGHMYPQTLYGHVISMIES